MYCIDPISPHENKRIRMNEDTQMKPLYKETHHLYIQKDTNAPVQFHADKEEVRPFYNLMEIKPPINLKFEKNKVHAIKELLQTERDYVKDLSHLVEVCLDALNRQQWIPEAHKKLIVRNSKEIFEFHKTFIVYYDTISTYDNDWSFIARTFLDQIDQFLLYKNYCDRHSDAWKLTSQYRDRPEWIQFLEDCANVNSYSIPFNLLNIDTFTHNQQHHKRLLFEDYLIKPVQRICRYQLLIKEVIRYTDYRTTEYALWDAVLHQLQHIVTDIDITSSHRDIQDRTHRFINRLISDWRISKNYLYLLGNVLIAGAIEVTYSTVGQSVSKTRYLGCFVFPTYIIIAYPKRLSSYEPKYWFPLAISDFENLDDAEGQSFIITCKKHIFAFRASCSLEKRIWVQKLQEAITTSKTTNKSMTDNAVTNLIIPSLHGIHQKLKATPPPPPFLNNPIHQSTYTSIHLVKEPVAAVDIKRTFTLKRSKSQKHTDSSKTEVPDFETATTIQNASFVEQKRRGALRRPKSMILLSSQASSNRIIRRMSMQFKSSYQLQVDIDHRLHDVCTPDYLSSRAWHRQLQTFESSTTQPPTKKSSLKKHKSMMCRRRRSSRLSTLSRSKWQDDKQNSDIDSTNLSSYSGHSAIREEARLYKNSLFSDSNRNDLVESPDSFGSESTYVEGEKQLVKQPSRTKLLAEKMKTKMGNLQMKHTPPPTQIGIDLLPEKQQLDDKQFGLVYAATPAAPIKHNKKWKDKLGFFIPTSILN